MLEQPLPWVDEGQQATQEDVDSQPGQSLQETWPCAADLFALVRANIGTERHLPRSCKAACKTLFRSLLDQAQDDPTGTTSLLLLCLPKLIWPRPREWGAAAPQGGQRAKWIHTRLQIATAGDWCQLLDTTMKECSRAPGPRGPEAGHLETDFDASGTLQPDTAQRVVASARQDCLLKAWKQIRSPPPTSCTDQVWQEATQKLQPHRCPPREAPRLTHELWKPSPANLTEVLGRLKPRKAADAGGWTHETAALLLSEPHSLPLVGGWLARLAAPTLHADVATALHHARLIALAKPEGGIRPIAVEMILLKVINMCLLSEVGPAMTTDMRGHQFGVGCPEGGLAMLLALQQHQVAHPDHAFIKLDLKNAFGSLYRETAQTYLNTLVLAEPARQACGTLLARPLCIPRPDHQTDILTTWDGLPQGDPLSAAFFAGTLTSELRHALEEILGDRARTLALYVDDAVIGAAPEDLQEILRQLPQKLATAGLQMASHKTQVWSPQGAQLRPFPSLQQLWEAQTEKRGLKIVGQAFGHDPLEGHAFGEASFVEDVLRQHLRELRRTVEAIRTLPAAAGAGQPGNQVAWSLLTNTLPSRILHLLRTHPVGLTTEFCEELQAMLQEAVLSILDVPSLTAVQWEMAFVPPPGGGLGLQHLPTSRIVARASALMAACRHFPASEILLDNLGRREGRTHRQVATLDVPTSS